MAKVSKAQATVVLKAVAEYAGKRLNASGKPVKTGHEAAYYGEGPELVMDWNGHPTVLWEGGDCAYMGDYGLASGRLMEFVQAKAREAGLFVEPYASYALSIYPL